MELPIRVQFGLQSKIPKLHIHYFIPAVRATLSAMPSTPAVPAHPLLEGLRPRSAKQCAHPSTYTVTSNVTPT